MSSLFYRSLGILVEFIQILILVRIVMSYINFNRSNSLVRLVYELTEPILAPARALIRMTGINTGMFDFSPLLAILLLNLIMGLVARIL
ncbi:MAG: YggT family protein [Tissierellaceae bacterium]|jgi:YggT family protein|nr:YggT family protein [Tissierellia bacterium]